jgi:hypothetical protein
MVCHSGAKTQVKIAILQYFIEDFNIIHRVFTIRYRHENALGNVGMNAPLIAGSDSFL